MSNGGVASIIRVTVSAMDTRRTTARESALRSADELGVSYGGRQRGWMGTRLGLGNPPHRGAVVHVFGLGLINEQIVSALGQRMDRRRSTTLAATMSVAVLLATLLHGLRSDLVGSRLPWLRALPDLRAAMLYSVSALTTYGHANTLLPERWKMLGALEALNGMLLFGLSTAFLFAVIQEVWALRSVVRRRKP